MKTVNSVHLAGLVDTCRIAGDIKGQTVAMLTVVTIHPRAREEDVFPGFEKIRHNVRVIADGRVADELRQLSRAIGLEKASGRLDLVDLHPCELDGFISENDGQTVINVPSGRFRFVEKARTKDNNVAEIVGKVVSYSSSQMFARMAVQTREGRISVLVPKEISRDAWESVASDSIKRGDYVSLSGPVLNGEYTDGKRRIMYAQVVPHVIERVNLKKDKTQAAGPVL